MNSTNRSSIDSILQEAQILATEGRIESVGEFLEKALNQNPDSTDLMAHLGYYYYRRGRLNRALDLFLQRNRLLEPNAEICLIIADIYIRRHDHKNERQWLQKANVKESVASYRKRFYMSYVREYCFSIRHFLLQSRLILSILNGIRRCQDSISVFLIYFAEKVFCHWLEPESGESPFHLTVFLNFARQYDREYRMNGLAYHKIREILIATRNLPIYSSHALILDIGTGLNTIPIFWSTKGCNVISLDGSTYGFQHLKIVEDILRREQKNPHIMYTIGDGTCLPIKDNTLDGVSALCMLEHIPEDGDIQCVAEIYRVLKPGGIVVLSVEACGKSTEGWLEVPYPIGYQSGSSGKSKPSYELEEVYCRNYSPEEMMNRQAQSSGWQIVRAGYYDDVLLPLRHWLSPTHFLSPWLRAMQPLLSLLFFRPASTSKALSPSSIGYLVLQKPL